MCKCEWNLLWYDIMWTESEILFSLLYNHQSIKLYVMSGYTEAIAWDNENKNEMLKWCETIN